MHRILFALLLLAVPATAQTYRPPFDPSAHKGLHQMHDVRVVDVMPLLR